MEIKVRCGNCDRGYRLPARVAGKSFRCKGCGEKVRVPAHQSKPKTKSKSKATTPSGRVDGVELKKAEPTGLDAVFDLPQAFDPEPTRRPRLNTRVVYGTALVAIVLLLAAGIWLTVDHYSNVGSGDAVATSSPGSTSATRGQRTRPRSDRDPTEDQRALDAWVVSPDPNEPPPSPRDRLPSGQRPNSGHETTGQSNTPEPSTPASPPDSHTWAQTFTPTPPIQLGGPSAPRPLSPSSPWSAQPDPPDPAMAFTPQRDLRLNINEMAMSAISRPATPSPFLLIGLNRQESDRRLVINLRNGSIVWALVGERPGFEHPAISPDGRTVALHGASHGQTNTIYIYTESRRRDPVEIPLYERFSGSQTLEFVDNHRLLLFEWVRREKGPRLAMYDTQSGDMLWEIEPTQRLTRSYAISPGGRYLALPFDASGDADGFDVIDLTQGQTVGQARLPDGRFDICEGVCFSPDGSKLAAFFGNAPGYVGVWELATGSRLYWTERARPKGTGNSTIHIPAGIAMLDNDRLVSTGYLEVVDALTGRIAGMHDKPSVHQHQTFRRALPDGYYLMVDKEERTRIGGPGPNWLTMRRLDPERLVRALDAIDVGGHAGESSLPLLSETYVSQARQGFYVDPAAPSPFPLSGVVPDDVVPASPSPDPIDWIDDDNATTPVGERWEVLTLTPASDDGLALADFFHRTHALVDLTGKRRTQLLQLPGHAGALSITRDGTRGLFRFGYHRIALMDLKTLEVIDSWRVRPRVVGLGRNNPQQLVEEAVLLGDDRLWVRESNGAVTVIDTTSRQVLMTGHKIASSLHAMTADQRYLVCINAAEPDEGALVLVETHSGRAVARLDLGGGKAVACAVHRETGQVASLVEDGRTQFLVVHDLRTGRQIGRNALPMADLSRGSDLRFRYQKLPGWIDADYVLLGHEVVHALTGRLAWSYDTYVKYARRQWEYGALWVYGHPAGDTPLRLAGLMLPHPEAAEQIQFHPEATDPLPLLIEPGMRIRVVVDRSVRHRAEVQTNMEASLSQAGFRVDPDALITMRISMASERDDLELNVGEPLTIRRQRDTFTCNWVMPGGEVVWTRLIGFGNTASWNFARRYPGLSPQAAHDQYLIDESPRHFEVSHFVPVPARDQLLGRTRVTDRGFEALPIDQE